MLTSTLKSVHTLFEYFGKYSGGPQYGTFSAHCRPPPSTRCQVRLENTPIPCNFSPPFQKCIGLWGYHAANMRNRREPFSASNFLYKKPLPLGPRSEAITKPWIDCSSYFLVICRQIGFIYYKCKPGSLHADYFGFICTCLLYTSPSPRD